MKILLAAATHLEMPNIENIKSADIDLLITGVGVPTSIYSLQKKISTYNYDCVIQAGIAGAFTNELDLGETVLVKQDTFGDIGIQEANRFTPIYNTDLFNKNEPPFINGWLQNNHAVLKKSSLELVRTITVNTVTDDKNTIKLQIENYNPEIETMEGAALHYVCLLEKISFVQIRSISNYVGERDKNKWKMKEAIENLSNEVNKLIELIQ